MCTLPNYNKSYIHTIIILIIVTILNKKYIILFYKYNIIYGLIKIDKEGKIIISIDNDHSIKILIILKTGEVIKILT